MQLTLDFKTEIETEFRFSLTIENYPVFINREKNYTFVSITGLNFLGKPFELLFSFSSRELEIRPNMVYIPELHTMSKNEVITFIKEVIFNHKSGKYEWDYKHRCRIFEF
jgi:hypothetical protein